MRAFAFPIALALLAPTFGFARVAAQSVHGVVVDDASGAPVSGAAVTLLGGAGVRLRVVETGEGGRFELGTPAPGLFLLTASRLGYATVRSRPVRVGPGEAVEVEARLAPLPLTVAPVEIRARAQGLRLELEPSLNRQWSPDRQRWEVSFRAAARMYISAGGEPCRPLLVLDGQRLGQGLALDEVVHPNDVAGLELYPNGNGAPPQYGGLGAPCGMIVVWTRR